MSVTTVSFCRYHHFITLVVEIKTNHAEKHVPVTTVSLCRHHHVITLIVENKTYHAKKHVPVTTVSMCRYHHAAACIPLLKMIFVFGGFEELETDTWTMTRTIRPTNTLWKFNIESHAWTWDQVRLGNWWLTDAYACIISLSN